VRIGDPPQTVKATFDTGSDVVWVNATCEETNLGVNAHTYGARTLCSQGRYYSRYSRSASLSESHKLTPLTYGIGNATVAKVQDNVQIVGTNVNITNMPFGVGVKTYDVLLGVFGVGYGDNPQTPWEGIVSLLQRNRYTDVKAFGLALGKWHSALKEDDGTVTFGGVDTKKFAGELVGFPLQHISDGVKRYAIRLASIGLTTSQYSKQYGHSSSVVVLDSGSTLTSLPPAIVEGLAADVGAKYQESTGLYNVDCRVLSDVSTVDFTFGTASDGNLTARVPLADLIVWSGGLDTCSLGVQPATSVDLAILGQGFLRRVY
ncbi:acid protease, partial [Thozetella sp. PMI_491]